MRISGFRFGRLRIPLKTPFRSAIRDIEAIDDVVIMIDTDAGNVGYGSAPTVLRTMGETHRSIIDAIRQGIEPHIAGMDISNLNQITTRIQQSLIRNHSAKSAVEIAVYDLFGQLHDAPLYKLLGGGVPRLSTDITISVDYIDKMVSDSLKMIEQGFDALKVMAGKDIVLDIKRVEAIYAAIGDQALIRLDGNEGWKPKEALVALRELEARSIPLELVEQPVAGHDREGLRYVAERVSTPVLTDEAIQSPLDAIDLIRMRAADMINIKLGRLGGISNAIKIADIAALHNVECMAGCVTESSISVAAMAHVAVAKANIITKIDLDAPVLSKTNPVKCGVIFDGPTIAVTDAPGLGVEAIEGLEML